MMESESALRQAKTDLRSVNKELRRNTVYRLGGIGGDEAIRLLTAALSDTHQDIIARGRAAQMLGKLKANIAVMTLINALGEDGHIVPISAAQALGKIGDKSAIGPLLNVLNSGCCRDQLKDAVSGALEELGYEQIPTPV